MDRVLLDAAPAPRPGTRYHPILMSHGPRVAIKCSNSVLVWSRHYQNFHPRAFALPASRHPRQRARRARSLPRQPRALKPPTDARASCFWLRLYGAADLSYQAVGSEDEEELRSRRAGGRDGLPRQTKRSAATAQTSRLFVNQCSAEAQLDTPEGVRQHVSR